MVENRIDRLVNNVGDTLDKPSDIEAEILSFIKHSLSSTSTLRAINPEVMNRGVVVNKDESNELIR